jgi:hypothetical protein
MSKEWMSTEYLNSTGNEDEWKKTQQQTKNTMDRPSHERRRKKGTILEEG